MEATALSTPLVALIVLVGIYLLTTAKNRKKVGTSLTNTVVESTASLEDSARHNRLSAQLEALQEITEEHGTGAQVKEKLDQYKELFDN